MPITIRVSLPGYDCLTDTNPDHYAVYGDQNFILIKQIGTNSGSVILSSGASATVSHNLGYVPYFLAYTNASFLINGTTQTGFIQCSSGGAVSVPQYVGFADGTNLYLQNNSSNTGTFVYFTFYDQQV